MGELICAIHQPNFFPRLSTLAKLYTADIWIVLDDVQFARRDYQHRCYMPLAADCVLPERWLTVPVHLPSGRATLIRDVRVADPAMTARRVPDTLRQYFKRSRYSADVLGLLPHLQRQLSSSERLTDVSTTTASQMLRLLGWPGAIVHSSDLPTRPGRSERLADLTSAVGAATYLCGPGGSRYLDLLPFTAQGTRVAMFHSPQHPAEVTGQHLRGLTALTDLAAIGPEALATQVRKHALEWRTMSEAEPYSEPTEILQAGGGAAAAAARGPGRRRRRSGRP